MMWGSHAEKKIGSPSPPSTYATRCPRTWVYRLAKRSSTHTRASPSRPGKVYASVLSSVGSMRMGTIYLYWVEFHQPSTCSVVGNRMITFGLVLSVPSSCLPPWAASIHPLNGLIVCRIPFWYSRNLAWSAICTLTHKICGH